MRIIKAPLFVLCLFICGISAKGQELASATTNSDDKTAEETVASAELEALIVEGNKLLGNGDFITALPVWLKALKEDKENSNINFKLGLCYHNSFDKQEKALPYFINSVRDLTEDYSFVSKTERNAPYDAIYFLAEAYMEADQHEQALRHFLIYKDNYKGAPPINVDKQVRSCMNAQKMVRSLLNVKFSNMGESINTGFAESNPVMAIDNSKLFFSSRRLRKDESNKAINEESTGLHFEDIYISQSSGNTWKRPRLYEHSTYANEAPLCLTTDGNRLFFRREVKGVHTIFQTSFSGGVWSAPVKLNSAVNSGTNQSGAAISPDGNALYFSSVRDGGYGGADIYKSVKQPDGSWGRAVNMGSEVNTVGQDVNPFMHPNGTKLYFSSNGWYSKGMGGYDIFFIAQGETGEWSSPQNIGYPINSTRDNMNFYVATNGQRYTTAISDKFNHDLYFLEEGKFDKNNLKPGTVVELQTELEVMEILELEKIVEKEVEVLEILEVETEVEKEVASSNCCLAARHSLASSSNSACRF